MNKQKKTAFVVAILAIVAIVLPDLMRDKKDLPIRLEVRYTAPANYQGGYISLHGVYQGSELSWGMLCSDKNSDPKSFVCELTLPPGTPDLIFQMHLFQPGAKDNEMYWGDASCHAYGGHCALQGELELLRNGKKLAYDLVDAPSCMLNKSETCGQLNSCSCGDNHELFTVNGQVIF